MRKLTQTVWFDYALIALGLLVAGVGYRMFLVPNDIAAGGFTGIGQLIHSLTGWPVGLVAALLNAPLFALSMKTLGLRFGLKSFIAMIALSLLIDHLPLGQATNDRTLAAVFGGVLGGAGLGLVLRGGATTGGSEMLGTLINRRLPLFTVGAVTFLVDGLVIVLSGFVFDAASAMYALIAAYLMNRVLDTVLEGPNLARAYYIISGRNDVIAGRILTEMDRGVTALDGKGMYSGEKRTVLLCVVNRMETLRLRRIVAESDPAAFMIATNVHEALGEGFSPHTK